MAGNFYTHSMFPYAGGDHHQPPPPPPQQPPPPHHHAGWGNGQIGFLSYSGGPEHHHHSPPYLADHMYPPPPPHHHTYNNYSPFFSNAQQQQPPPQMTEPFWANPSKFVWPEQRPPDSNHSLIYTDNAMHSMDSGAMQQQMEPTKPQIEQSGIKTYSSSNLEHPKTSSSRSKQMSWASIASQPAKPVPKSLKSKLATAVLSTTKHVPPPMPPPSNAQLALSDEGEPTPSSVWTAKNKPKTGGDNNDNAPFSSEQSQSDHNSIRDHSASSPTPEPTPAQAAEMLAKEQKKDHSASTNREQPNSTNSSNSSGSHRRDSKGDYRHQNNSNENSPQQQPQQQTNERMEQGRFDSSRFSSKSSLNSSYNSFRSARDDSSNFNQQQQLPQPPQLPHQENPRDFRSDSQSRDNPREFHRDQRDFRREPRDYQHVYQRDGQREQFREHPRDQRPREFYQRGDNRRQDGGSRWEDQQGHHGPREGPRDRHWDNHPQQPVWDGSREESRDFRDVRRDGGNANHFNANHHRQYNNDNNYGNGPHGNNFGGNVRVHHNNPSHSYGNNYSPNSPRGYNKQMNNRPVGGGGSSGGHMQQRQAGHNSGGRMVSGPGAHSRVIVKPNLHHNFPPLTEHQHQMNEEEAQALLDKLRCENDYNPTCLEQPSKSSRFFIIKSYSEDDVHRSIKYSIWCSTEHGNAKLDAAYRSQETLGPVYLFYSVNGSGHFCGVAQMLSSVDYKASSGVWAQDKWKGQFRVKWIYVKDVPNQALKHITLENNEYKPVTYSRDTQEVPHIQGREVFDIIHNYEHCTSIFDDFLHYEKKQIEEHHYRRLQQEMAAANASSPPPPLSQSFPPNHYNNHDHPQHRHNHHHQDQRPRPVRTLERAPRPMSSGDRSSTRSTSSSSQAARSSPQSSSQMSKKNSNKSDTDVKSVQQQPPPLPSSSSSPQTDGTSGSSASAEDSKSSSADAALIKDFKDVDAEIAAACLKFNLKPVWADN